MTTIQHSTLSNGVRVVTESDPARASAAVRWLVPTGVARDPAQSIGLSAVVEELLMRGAADLDSRAQSDAFDVLGASRGTETHTFFHSLSLTCLAQTLPGALPLLVQMVLEPTMSASAIEASKQLCAQAVHSVNDEPQERLRYEFRPKHAPAPADRSPLGTLGGIESIGADLPARWWKQHATPGGSIIAAAGGIQHGPFVDLLESLLVGWSGAASPVTLADTPEPGVHHVEQDSNQAHIALSYPAPIESSPEAPLERMAVAVLSGGMAGRLFTNLRERRSLCYSVHASYSSNDRYARTSAYIGTQPERADEAYACLVEEMESIHADGRRVTADEFERARVGLLSRLVMSGESTRARAASLAHDISVFGVGRSLDERRAAYDAITLERLNAYLRDHPRPAHTAMVVGPEPLQALAED